VAKKQRLRISKIRKANRRQLGDVERNLANFDTLITCGISLLTAFRHWYRRLLFGGGLVLQERILHHSDSRIISHRIMSFLHVPTRPIV
jgi:hypothetical protein